MTPMAEPWHKHVEMTVSGSNNDVNGVLSPCSSLRLNFHACGPYGMDTGDPSPSI